MMQRMRRLCRHLLSTPLQVKRAFPEAALSAIETQIRASESLHTGEIRFAVEAGLSGSALYLDLPARERAIDVFAQLRMWDTEQRNGVLIYLLLADHAVEIVADRGVDSHTGEQAWQQICAAMEAAFRARRYESGILEGIRAVSALLEKYFPTSGASRNELPDKVVVL
jgi:hypothetical protein